MRRRAVLGAVGAGLVSFAGCSTSGTVGTSPATARSTTSAAHPSSTDTPTSAPDSPVPTPDYPESTGEVETFDPAETVEEVQVGSREGVANPDNNLPHDVRVWNRASTDVVARIRLVDYVEGSVALDETYDLPADAAVTLSILEPSSYVLEVRVPEAGTRETLSVPRPRFDCNNSATRVAVSADGNIDSMLITTAVFCRTATPTDG